MDHVDLNIDSAHLSVEYGLEILCAGWVTIPQEIVLLLSESLDERVVDGMTLPPTGGLV